MVEVTNETVQRNVAPAVTNIRVVEGIQLAISQEMPEQIADGHSTVASELAQTL